MRIPVGLFFVFLFCSRIAGAQSGSYAELRKQVEKYSYADSSLLFQYGSMAIKQAAKENFAVGEAEVTIYYGNFFFYANRFSEARKMYMRAIDIATSAGNTHFADLARLRINYLPENRSRLSERISVINDVMARSKKENDYRNIIECLNSLSQLEEERNNFKQSAETYIKALRIAEENNDPYYTATILNNLGTLKLNSKQEADAIKEFSRALSLAKAIDNSRLVIHVYNNLAIVLMNTSRFAEAKKIYAELISYARRTNSKNELVAGYLNVANAEEYSNNRRAALAYFDSAEVLMRQGFFHHELAKVLFGKAKLLVELKEQKKADDLIREGFSLIESGGGLEDRIMGYQVRSQWQEKFGSKEQALNDFKRYVQLNDSLAQLKNSDAVAELQIAYEVEKNEAELEKQKSKVLLLEKENELEKANQQLVLIALISIFSVVAVAVYLRNASRRKAEQQRFSQELIDQLEKERNRIAIELHDNIGQTLSILKARAHMLSTGSSPSVADAAELEKQIGTVIEDIREVSKKLLPSYIEKIGLVRSVARLLSLVQESTSLVCSFDIDESVERLNISQRTHLYRIIQECVNNTVKHAEASALKVTIELEKDKLLLTYMDNGKGISSVRSASSEGIGMINIRERTRILEGKLHIFEKAGSGFKLAITIPYKTDPS